MKTVPVHRGSFFHFEVNPSGHIYIQRYDYLYHANSLPMKLSQAQKVIIGILTLFPFILAPYIGYEIFHFVMETIEATQSEEDPAPATIFAGVISVLFPIILLSVSSLGLLIFYIIHVISNKNIESAERIAWILIFVFIGIIAFPIYWFMRLWNETR